MVNRGHYERAWGVSLFPRETNVYMIIYHQVLYLKCTEKDQSVPAPSALLLALWHSREPKEEHSACNIHKDVHPHEPKVPPNIIIRDSDSTQEHIRIAE